MGGLFVMRDYSGDFMSNFKISDCKVIKIAEKADKEIIDYGVKMVGAPLEWHETMGEGIKVGIIDTGVDSDHPEIVNRIKDGVNFSGGNMDDFEDENGHGTHICGIVAAEKNGIGIVGVAPKADLYVAKAFNKSGKTSFDAIEKSVKWLMEKNVDVINMSFSSSHASGRYKSLIADVYRKGISIICAAGNEGELGENTIGYPANFPETIAVSAVDINKNIADFSSQGHAAEISAAGIDIYSTYLNGGYATLSGTSMATPIITGAVAILMGKGRLRYDRKLTPDEIRLLLNIYTDNVSRTGRDKRYGYGIFSFGRIGNSNYYMNEILNSKQQNYTKKSSTAADVAAVLMAYKFLNLF